MSTRTTSSMWAERNREDARLLAAGDYATLLATYYDVIVDRCLARLRSRDDAYEVAHMVVERLARELRAGRTYNVPFSVVVHKVINWKVVEFFAQPGAAPLPEDWEAGGLDRALEDFEGTYDLEELFSRLAGRACEVLELTYLDGLEPDEIAERLGMERNAVYQALHRGHKKLREFLLGDE
jgi:RNA polymerase sigma factor (sigma-70 family)